MVSYGKNLQAQVGKIQVPMQRSMVPVTRLIARSMNGEVIPPDEFVEQLILATSLGTVGISRATRVCRDITRDALTKKYKVLASKKHAVSDGKLFGPEVEEEYRHLVDDIKDALVISQVDDIERPFLEMMGRAGAPVQKDQHPRKSANAGNSGSSGARPKQRQRRPDYGNSNTTDTNHQWNNNNNNSDNPRGRGQSYNNRRGDRRWTGSGRGSWDRTDWDRRDN